MRKKTIQRAFLLSLLATTAQASDYGCKVLLCLSNPLSNGGPKGIAECVAPINQLFRDLEKGHVFPSCDLADGNNGNNYAKLTSDPYDRCPDGTQPAEQNSWIAKGAKTNNPSFSMQSYNVLAQPKQSQPMSMESTVIGAARACVGGYLGSYTAQQSGDESPYDVNVYQNVTWQSYQSPRAIDVYINNSFFQRIHW
jgi:hypothetical protein